MRHDPIIQTLSNIPYRQSIQAMFRLLLLLLAAAGPCRALAQQQQQQQQRLRAPTFEATAAPSSPEEAARAAAPPPTAGVQVGAAPVAPVLPIPKAETPACKSPGDQDCLHIVIVGRICAPVAHTQLKHPHHTTHTHQNQNQKKSRRPRRSTTSSAWSTPSPSPSPWPRQSWTGTSGRRCVIGR